MKQYIGVKLVHAEPATKEEAEELLGREIPYEGDGLSQGYLVEYADGYQSWSPKESFEQHYHETEGPPPYAMEIDGIYVLASDSPIITANPRHISAGHQPVPKGVIGVRYIGNREEHVDNLYGSNLVWAPGQVHAVAASIAAKMLPHTDVYAQVDLEIEQEIQEIQEIQEADKPQQTDPVPPVLPNLETMSKTEMINFAQAKFGEVISKHMQEAAVRSKLFALIQARGLTNPKITG